MNRLHHPTMRVTPGRGNKVENNRRSIAIRFDEETFALIRDRAIQHRTGFAEQVRALVERALTAEEIAAPVQLQRKRA